MMSPRFGSVVPVLNETVEAGDETLNGDCAAEHGHDQRHGYRQLLHVRFMSAFPFVKRRFSRRIWGECRNSP
jgi:hypothetical protein